MSTNTMNTGAEQRLKDLARSLPRPPTPLGAYVEAVQTGNLLFLSGTLPVEGGAPKFLGRIGGELSIEDGRRATRKADSGTAGCGSSRYHVRPQRFRQIQQTRRRLQ